MKRKRLFPEIQIPEDKFWVLLKKPTEKNKCPKCKGKGKTKIGEASFLCSHCNGTGKVNQKDVWYVKEEPVEIIKIEVCVTKFSEEVRCYIDKDTWYEEQSLFLTKNAADYECCSRNDWKKPEEVKEAEICKEPPF